MPGTRPLVILAIGAVSAGIGGVCFALEPAWVDAIGYVTEVHVRTTKPRHDGFRPAVHYRYEVAGQEHRFDRAWCVPPRFEPHALRESALADAATIKLGDPLPIKHRVDVPAESTCLTEHAGTWRRDLGLSVLVNGGVSLLLGMVDLAGAVRRRRGRVA